MYELPLPTEHPFDIFSCLVPGTKFATLLANSDVRDSVWFFDEIYRIKGATASLNTLPVLKKAFLHQMSKEEMESLYKNRLVKSTGGRDMYDNIMKTAINRTCPLCSLRKVSTLDHYLPQAHYPQYTLLRVNLYPACMECNKAKTDKVNPRKAEQTYHPFFDKLRGILWLSAEYRDDPSPALHYYVNGNVPNTYALRDRMRYHFDELALGDLYASYAGQAFSDIKDALQRVYRRKGAVGVQKYLARQWRSYRKSNPNSWETVFYETLKNCPAFYSGGFNNIAMITFP